MKSPRRPPKRPRAVQAFEAKAGEGARACGLDKESAPLLVGFSGGADSTALLLWLAASSSRPLIAVHVQHGLRGARAERDARHAARLCRGRGIPFRLVRVRVARRSARGLEAAAREARRKALLAAAKKAGARAVALAHTLDDQAETVLMRLFEGSGPAGLAGMRPSSPLKEGEGVSILRPLLRVRREEARAYLRALKVKWVEDETNRDEGRLRNRLRRRLWPLIERALGPSAAEGAARSAELLGAAREALDASVKQARAELLQALRAGLWRAALEGARGGVPSKGRSPLGRHLEALDRLALEGGPSAGLDLPGGLQARRGYDSLAIGPRAEAAPAARPEVPLKTPGKTVHPELGIVLQALARRSPVRAGDRLATLLDADRLGEGAVLRARREGDRFHPAGAPGGRKLKEYFIDRKVPREERDRVPLLAVGGEVAWVVGHQASEKFKARPDSKRLISLRARPFKG